MALANDSILVTPGSGATVATHTPGGSNTTEYQVVILASSSGHVQDTQPTFLCSIPGLDVAANRYHWELFNGSASTRTLTLRGIWPLPKLDTNLIQTISPSFMFYRTTAISSGGTAGTYEATSAGTLTANFARMNPSDSLLSSAVSAKTVLTSITTGTYLFTTWVSTSSALAWAGLQQYQNVVPDRFLGEELVIPAGQGIAVRQGTVASTGTVGWLVQFTTDPY